MGQARTESNTSLALCGLSALKVLRTLRQRGAIDIASLPRVDLTAPNPGDGRRWTPRRITEHLEPWGCVAHFSEESPLSVAVPRAKDRVRAKGARSVVYSSGLPSGAFLDLGDGLLISSPELLFIELATIMSIEVQLLCGLELCGTFSRDAASPRNGDVTYQIPPVTCEEKIRAFIEGCSKVNGLGQAREAVEWLLDNAWSPMEAVVAELAVLPAAMLGYDLWPVELNPRLDTEAGATKDTRVPDVVFRGTDVGLNYDGEGHLPLQDIVDAAMRVALSPQEEHAELELASALERVRDGSVSDKRRDRDLATSGMTVFAMTKEDLYERGALDRLMQQVINTIERKGGRRLHKQRLMLESSLLANMRQELIWSLLPGKVGMEHAAVYAQLMAPNPDPMRYMHKASFDGQRWNIALIERSTGKRIEE